MQTADAESDEVSSCGSSMSIQRFRKNDETVEIFLVVIYLGAFLSESVSMSHHVNKLIMKASRPICYVDPTAGSRCKFLRSSPVRSEEEHLLPPPLHFGSHIQLLKGLDTHHM